MKQLIRYILLVVVCICTFLLSGCSFVWTTENGDPATPEDIKASVEKEFAVVHPNLVLQSSVVEQEKPFQRNVYVFYDESNGFSFTTNSVVQRPTLPVPGGERYTNETGYVNAQAVSDKNIVTANGVGHLEFTREILSLLKANTSEKIAAWYDFYKNGFVK